MHLKGPLPRLDLWWVGIPALSEAESGGAAHESVVSIFVILASGDVSLLLFTLIFGNLVQISSRDCSVKKVVFLPGLFLFFIVLFFKLLE